MALETDHPTEGEGDEPLFFVFSKEDELLFPYISKAIPGVFDFIELVSQCPQNSWGVLDLFPCIHGVVGDLRATENEKDVPQTLFPYISKANCVPGVVGNLRATEYEKRGSPNI